MPSSVKRTLSGSSLQRRGRGKRSVERRRRSLPETDESPFSPTGTAEEEPPAAVVFDAGASGGPIPSSTPPRPSPSGSWNFAAPAPPPLSTSSLESRSNSTSGLPSSRRSYENLAEVSPASAAANNALMLRSSSRNSSGSWSGMLWEAPPSPPSQPSPPPSAAVVSLSTENPLMLPTMMGTSPPIISVLKTASEACDTESVGNLSVSFAPAAGELEPFVPHKNRERVSKQGGSKGATKKKATKIGISFRERIQSGVAPPPRKKIARRSTSQKRNSFSGTGILRRSSTSSLNGSRRSSSASRQRNNGFIILSYMAVFCVRVVSVIKRKRAAEIFQSTTGPRAAFIIQCAWRRKAQRERVHRAETVIFLVAWLRFRLRHLRFAKEKSALLLQRVFRGERDRQFHQYLYDHMYRSRGIDFIRRRVMCLEAAKVLCHLRMERDERNVMHQDCAMTSMRLLREERREWMELMCHACHVLGRQAVYTENDWAAQVMACTGASPYVTSTHDEEHDRYSPVDPSQLSPSPVDEEQPTITTLSAVPAPHVGHSKHHIPANTAPRFSSKSDDTSSTYSLPQRGALREERSSQLSEWSSRGESPQEHNPLVAGGRGYRYNAVPRHERRSSDSQRNRQLYYYSSSSSSNGDVLFFGLAEEDMQLDSATLPAAMRQTASSKVFLDSVQLESSLLQDSPPKTATALHGVSPTCFNVPSLLETPQGAATYLRALFSFESSRYLHSGVTRRVSVSFPVSSPDEAGAVPTHKTPAERQEGGGEMVGSQLLSPLTIGAGHTGGQVAQFGINSGRCADPILMEFLRLLERTESIERRQLQQELLDAHHAFLLPVSAINQAIALSPSVPPIFAPLLLAMRDGFFLRRAVALLQEEQLCRLVIIEDYEAIPLHCLNRPLVNKVAEERRRRLLRRAQDAACPLAEAEAREGAFFDQLTTLVEEVEQAGGMEGCRVVASSVDPAEATITLLGQRRAEGNKAARKCRFRVQMAPVLPPSAMELIPVSPATTAVGSSTTAAATSGMAPPVHAPRSMSTSHEGTAVSPSKEDRPPHDEMLGEMVEVGEGSGGGGGEDADSFLAGASSASSATVILPPWEAPLRSQSSGEPQVLTDSSMIPGSVVQQQQQQLGAVQEEVLEEAPPLFVVPDRLHNGPPVPMLRVLHPQDGPISRRHHLRASNAPTAEIESVERVQLECSHSGADFQQRASIPMPVVDGAAVSVPATLEEVPAGNHSSAAFGAGSPLHHPVSPLPNPYSLDSFNGVAASATDDETPLPATTPAAGVGKGGPGSPRGLPPLPPTRAAYGTSRLRPLVEQSVEAVAEEAHHRTTPLVTRAEELAWDGTRPKSEGGRSTNSLATATAATAAAPPARPPPTPPPRRRVVEEAQHLELGWDEAEVVAGPAPMLTSVSAPEWHTPELLGESERHSSRGATSLLLPPIRLSRDQRAPPPFASAVL